MSSLGFIGTQGGWTCCIICHGGYAAAAATVRYWPDTFSGFGSLNNVSHVLYVPYRTSPDASISCAIPSTLNLTPPFK